MKKLILLGLVIALSAACNEQKQRYTQQSPEIETIKTLIKNYNNKAIDISIYADSSKTYYNSKTDPMSPSETKAYHEQREHLYSSRMFTDEDPEYEMVVTDDGETWVNCWLNWKGSLAGNEKEIDMPIHLTYQFIDGKIVREVGMWDPTEIVLTLQAIELEKNMSVDEKTIKTSMDIVVKAWNNNDQNLMASVMTNNFIRTANGVVIANNAAEYGTNLMDLFFGSFPDFKVTLINSATINNKIHINWMCTGTNTKPYLGKDATNRTIKTYGHSVWTIEKDGKFSREDAFYDNLTVFQQLGTQAPK
ncbi:ester cyclase [Mariniflexile sp.]|uniref:ester cyclase n=1 Tax=Mariniflexile sp. TaxID=1979402 RepID=UPI0035677BC5